MADEKETKFTLSADTKQFVESISNAQSSVKSLGSSENLVGLVEGLVNVGVGLGVVGAAVYAVKTAMDLVFDAENIKAVNAQFEDLTQNAGIATDTLKSGLIEAGHGLVDDTDLLKAANKALVEMGDRASELPQVMELARQATAVFGGDLISRFEQINQAIATGNVRLLRQIGLKVDQKKAEEDYAKSIGVSASVLSEAGKQEAIRDAVLKAGQERFQGVNADLKENTNLWIQLKVTMSEVGEAIALAFDKTLGPYVKGFLKDLKDVAGWAKTEMAASFGEGSQQSAAQLKVLSGEASQLRVKIDQLQKSGTNVFSQFFKGDAKAQIEESQAELAKVEKQIDGLTTSIKSSKSAEDAAHGSATQHSKERLTVLEKENDLRIKSEKELLALKSQTLKSEEVISTTENQVAESVSKERVMIEQEEAYKIADIKRQFRKGDIIDQASTDKMIEEVHQTSINKLRALDKDYESEIRAAEDRRIAQAKNTGNALVAAAQVAADREKRAWSNSAAQSKAAVDDFTKYSMNAFHAVGEGSKSVAEAMRDIAFNMAADRADAMGKTLLLEGLVTLNPFEVAGATALIALAGFLRGQTQSGGSGASTPDVGGSGSGIASSDSFGTRTDTGMSLQQAQQQKSVSIEIHGNYFETEQTKTALVDMIRQNQDATDYKVTSIGGGV